MKDNRVRRPKIGIYDLTDCEGCEIQFINFREKILKILEFADITQWRLVAEKRRVGKFDIVIVEGSVQTEEEIEFIKRLRKNSRYIIALGACACIGGIPSLAAEVEEREELAKRVYGPDYKLEARECRPINAYTDVDLYIDGCPPPMEELEKITIQVFGGKASPHTGYPVCRECPLRKNCLIKQGKVCLGIITNAGCQAICVTEGRHCYGCQGPTAKANLRVWKKRVGKFLTDDEIEEHLSLFWKATSQYKRMYE